MRWIRFTLGALGALLLVFATGAELGLGARPLQQEPLACLGETRSLIVSSGMPYTPVRVQGRTGFFVVDLGADGSAISPGTFLGGWRASRAVVLGAAVGKARRVRGAQRHQCRCQAAPTASRGSTSSAPGRP